jgi:hypothetical protein
MPTGLTEKIKDGMTFPEFALKCARQFGGLVHMRDEASGAKITLPTKTDYYKDELAKIKAKLKELSKITVEEYKSEAIEERKRNIINAEQTIKDKAILKAQYMEMLNHVKAWNPPTDDHKGLKKMMEVQITDSISFDCNTTHFERLLNEYKKPVNVQEILYEQIDELQEDEKYFTDKLKEESKDKKDNAQWVVDLVDSLRLTPEQRGKLIGF